MTNPYEGIATKITTENPYEGLATKFETGIKKGEPIYYEDLSEYYGDRLQKGLTATPSMVGAAYRTLFEDPFNKGSVDSFGELFERFGENYKNYQKGYQDLFGMEVDDTGKQAKGFVHQVIGTGLEMAVDPFFVLKGAKTVGEALTRSAQFGGVGMTAELGGEGGAQIEQTFTGEDSGKGRMIGSLGGVLLGATITKPTIEVGKKATKDLYYRIKDVKANPDEVISSLTLSNSKGFIEELIKESPDLLVVMKHIDDIGIKWNTGEFPLLVAAGKTPSIRAEMVKLAKKDPLFRSGLMKELDKVAKQIETRADELFGSRYAPLPSSKTEIKQSLQNRTKNLIKHRQVIDEKISKLNHSLDSTKTELERGQAIKNLVETRKMLAKKETSPIYTEILEDAKKAGVRISPDNIESFYIYVKKYNIDDLFGPVLDVDKKVFRHLKPKEVRDDLTRLKRNVYSEMTFSQFESLKKAKNALWRSPLTETEKRKLGLFEIEFKKLRDNIEFPPEVKVIKTRLGNVEEIIPAKSAASFNERLLAVDKLYYEKIGIPYGSEAIAQIGRKKYDSEIANVILKNREALDQYLSVSDIAGQQIARDALMARLHSKAVVSGVLNHKKLKSEVFKMREVVDGIPGARDEINKILSQADYLNMRVATLDDVLKNNQKRISDNWLTISKQPSYESVLVGSLNNRGTLNKVLSDIKKLDASTRVAVETRLRRELVTFLGSQPSGAYKYLTNPANKYSIEKIMGKGYQKDLKELTEIMDLVRGIDITKLSTPVLKTATDPVSRVLPGVQLTYVTSQVRDRIANPLFRVFRIATKMSDFKIEKAANKAVFELITQPGQVKKVLNAANDFVINPGYKDLKETFIGTLKETLPVYMYIGSKTGISHKAEEIEQKIQ